MLNQKGTRVVKTGEDKDRLRRFNVNANFENLAPVVRKVDNAIRRINHYPVDSVVCFVNTYPLDSDLSSG